VPGESELQLSYRRVWEAFTRASSTADGRHDTPRWRGSSGPYAACIVRVPAEALQPQLAGVRDCLQGLAEVRLHPDHFLHIMLQELGFVVPHPSRQDEISAGRLEEFAQSAVDPVSSTPPFQIEIGPVNAFEDAVFLETGGGARLTRLHSRLFELAAIPSEPDYPFLPHCTIAHFTGVSSTAGAAEAMSLFRSSALGRLPVTEVEIVTMEASEPYPELKSYAVIPLGK
jgi:RNA 2',3'-cyclic 3'-phosphodiesterase